MNLGEKQIEENSEKWRDQETGEEMLSRVASERLEANERFKKEQHAKLSLSLEESKKLDEEIKAKYEKEQKVKKAQKIAVSLILDATRDTIPKYIKQSGKTYA